MAKERIQFEKIFNTRDLGGYITKEGRVIKPKKLIRSGALFHCSENDINKLVNEYELRTIVDFRNDNEINQQPDPVLENVKHIQLNVFKEPLGPITREKRWKDDDPLGLYFLLEDSIRKELESGEVPTFYDGFVVDEHSVNQYKAFMEVLLNNKEGSTLWHCSAGKDRCGMGSVYLLKALGMSDELIYEDYLASNDYFEEVSVRLCKIADERGLDTSFHDVIRAVNGVRKEFLDRVYALCDELYGGMDKFLEQRLGLDEAKIKALRDLYLD